MATPVIMPRQGQSVESCIIGKWHKQVGDKVNVGDVLFTYETDKSTFDEEAKVEGTLLAVFFEEGDDVPCLLNVCVIGNEGESTDEFKPAVEGDEEEEAAAPAEEAVAEAASAVETVQRAAGEFVPVSPRARILAEKTGVDVTMTPASGPNGRVIERDVQGMIDAKKFATPAAMAGAAGKNIEGTGLGGRVTTADIAAAAKVPASAGIAAAASDEPEFEEVKLPNIRKVIAKSMHASLSNMAQLTLNTTFDATDVLAFRAKLKADRERMGLNNITINDIVLYAVSRTVLNHKDCNAHFYDDKIVYFKNANIGMAVDTPRGLLVPTVFHANKMSLNELAQTTKALGASAQEGTISPDLLQGGTITVSNLGTMGIESFTPVINPPQTCILGVDTIMDKVRVVDGEIKAYKAIGLSLTFDHRALDGAPAARFLKELVKNLENFSVLLAK